jgi:AcrR family transcriptional regulator
LTKKPRPPAGGRENHRERLLQGALRCLREKGYAHTTARDIAAASDANLGSIGYHFGSKEALLGEALSEGFRQWTQHIGRRALKSESAGPLEHLRNTWSAAAESVEQQRGLMLAFLEALPAAARSPELRTRLAEAAEEARQATEAMIAAAMPAGEEVDQRAARTLASLLIAVVDGLVLQFAIDPERAPSADELSDVVDLALPQGLVRGTGRR